MALIHTEEQDMLRQSARVFLAENAPVAQLRQLRDSQAPDGFDRGLWARFAEMGYTGILVPEAQGGLGLGPVEAGLVMEEIGRHLSASPFLASAVVATTALLQGGSPAQQDRWLPALARGEKIASLAVDEQVKHRPAQVALTASPTAGGFRLDGEKLMVVDGQAADLFIVAARTAGKAGDSEGISLLLVERGQPGLTVERVAMVDARPTARLRFSQAELPASALLGTVGQGWPVLQAALDAGRLAVAAELLGLADETFARALTYLKERKQFGKLIGEFQALQHRAAELYCDIEISRAALLHAQQQLAAGAGGAAQAIAVAKARAGSTATRAVQEGVQMFGGMGMTDAFDQGLFMKRARVLQELFGDHHYQGDWLAQQRGY